MGLELLKQKESENLEFKSSLSEWKEILKTISSFANTKGGNILVGISDKREIVGLQIGKKTIEDLANKIKENTDPKIFPSISIENINGKDTILIKVGESRSKSVFAFDRAYKRVGKSTVRATSEEIRNLALEGRKVYWDEQICEAALEDIDEEKVRWYLEKREEIRGIRKPEAMSLKELLLNIGCAKETNDKLKPTNAGILFFGKEPQRFILQSQLRLARFAGKALTRNFLDRLDCSGTLWEMIDQTEDFIRKNIRLFGFRTEFSFRRIDKLEYPIKAIREAIINALIHRDYFATPDTRIAIFEDRIEVISPGPFPQGVTPEKPKHVPVNPSLCQLMYDVGYIEKYGSGIYLINELCEEWGIPKPEFEISEIETKVIFRSSGKAIVIGEIEKLGVELNERQRKALQYAFRDGFITNKVYRELNKVSHETAIQELTQLVEKGLLTVSGKGRGTKYLPKI